MSVGKVTTIFRKELKYVLRDRRTLIFMMAIPILAMPVIMTFVSKLMISQQQKLQTQIVHVALLNSGEMTPELHDSLFADTTLEITEASAPLSEVKDSLSSGAIEAILEFPDHFTSAIENESTTDLTIYFDGSEDASREARDRLSKALDNYSKAVVSKRIAVRNIDTQILSPYDVADQNVAPPSKQMGSILGGVLAYILALMCFLGTMHPALDLAVGEKERGTLETLLVAPASRAEFVIGKFGVVMLSGVIAGFLSLISMTFAFNHMLSSVGEKGAQMMLKLEPTTMLLVILIVIPLAGLFAAVLLSLSIFAKSSKEAQGYMTAVNMALIIPAIVAFLPGIKINTQLAFVPIVNVVLIIKSLIGGELNVVYLVIALASMLILAGLSLIFAKWWFEREQVLFRI